MTDTQNQTQNSTKDTDNPEERQLLRERAKTLGISHSPNISNALLRERIAAKLNDTPDPGEDSDDSEPGNESNPFDGDDDNTSVMDDVAPEQIASRVAASVNASNKPMTKKQQIQALREKQWEEELRLVRIRVACLNPQKKDLKGEVFTVSNKFLGTVRKFVPFGEATDDGYHVPHIIYTEMLNRQFQSITVEKKGNVSLPKHRLIKEFAIEVLPDLTPEQLHQLAVTQAVAANQ